MSKRPPSGVLRHFGLALVDLRYGASFWTPMEAK